MRTRSTVLVMMDAALSALASQLGLRASTRNAKAENALHLVYRQL